VLLNSSEICGPIQRHSASSGVGRMSGLSWANLGAISNGRLLSYAGLADPESHCGRCRGFLSCSTPAHPDLVPGYIRTCCAGSWRSLKSMVILEQAGETARTFRPISKEKITALLAKTAQAASKGEYEPFKTSSIFDGTAHNPHCWRRIRTS